MIVSLFFHWYFLLSTIFFFYVRLSPENSPFIYNEVEEVKAAELDEARAGPWTTTALVVAKLQFKK